MKMINDLPRIDRPREKLMHYGVSKLKDEELLAILIRTGKRNRSSIQIAKDILKKYENNLVDLTFDQLVSINGIGSAKACEILATIELGKRNFQTEKNISLSKAEDVWRECIDFRTQKKEHFVAFLLDSRNRKISKEVISVGTLTSSLVHPREVFEPAIKQLAVNIIFAHNHPSNDTEPSTADIQITKQLVVAGKILGIKVLDHIIVTETKWLSMADEGYI